MPTSYLKLAVAVSINAVIMFVLTYALIDSTDHFYPNINRAFMAFIMVAPMVVVMLVVMRSMYTSPVANVALVAVFVIGFAVVFAAMRTQTLVGDVQFLRSMIPHHSSAIVMCERAAITDRDIIDLCGRIVKAQKEEIAQMQAILERH
jgi:hypothetical protein